MFQTKQRRFRPRTNGRRHAPHRNGSGQSQSRPNSFTNGQSRSNFKPFQSAEKLFEKYTSLAKEAMSSGDKTLSENYLQHADHFIRVIDEKNKNRIQNNSNVSEETTKNYKSEAVDSPPNKDEAVDSSPNKDKEIKN